MNKELKRLSSLEKLVDFIASEYNPEKIILFGSYSTQRSTEISDIDLLIIKKTNKRFVDRVVELIQLIRSKFGFEYPIEPLIYTPNEFRRAKKINSLFIRTVLSKGVFCMRKNKAAAEIWFRKAKNMLNLQSRQRRRFWYL